jgi:hypothetical protein
VIRAIKSPDRVSVIVKCVRKESTEVRMLALFYALQRQGKRLPVVGESTAAVRRVIPKVPTLWSE